MAKRIEWQNYYKNTCQLFDRGKKERVPGRLRLTEKEFKAFRQQYVVDFIRPPQPPARSTKANKTKLRNHRFDFHFINPPDKEWEDFGWELHDLQLKMAVASNKKQYESAREEFDRILKTLNPPKPKHWNRVREKPLDYLKLLHLRMGLWCILMGERSHQEKR